MLVESIDPILPKKQLIEKIKTLQDELHISGAEIARAIKVTPTAISKVLAGNRDLSYEEVQMMINYVVGRISIIPSDEGVRKYATTFDKLEWAYDDETVGDVTCRMFHDGFSQFPVKSRASDDFLGMVTETSILKRILHPEVNNKKLKTLGETGSLRISEAGVIEEIPRYPIGSKMIEISQVLTNYYAVLLTSGENVVGIITRADILKFFNIQK